MRAIFAALGEQLAVFLFQRVQLDREALITRDKRFGGTLEDAIEAVVIAGWDGIEFVIVATSA